MASPACCATWVPALPVYGLQAHGLQTGESLPASIEEIATDYLAQIRHIQPEGPYRLIGRSLGGLIGYAIAEQMQAQGLEVELLAMIDSYLFTAEESAGPRSEADEVRAVLSFLGANLAHEDTPQTLKELAGVLVQTYDPQSIPLLQEIIRAHPHFIHNLCEVMLNHLELARRYVPGKLDLDLLYFQAMERKGHLDKVPDRTPDAWRPFVRGGIEVHELACHHEAVLDPVPAALIGSVLQKRFSSHGMPVTQLPSSIVGNKTGATTASYV